MLKYLLALTLSLVAVAHAHEVKPITEEFAKEYGLDRNFFKKGTMAEGIFIATSAQVSDYAHLEAAYQFGNMMSALKPEIAKRIRDGKVLCILVGHKELTSDIPEFKSDKVGKELAYYNWRSRGFLTLIDKRPTVLFSEEDVLEYEGGMQVESILIHEFGHVIHRPGFPDGFDDQLMATWKAAKVAGLWNDGYASQPHRYTGRAQGIRCRRLQIPTKDLQGRTMALCLTAQKSRKRSLERLRSREVTCRCAT
jgi:hypothetical protein